MPVKKVELKVTGGPSCFDWLTRRFEARFVGLLSCEFLAYEMRVQRVFHLFVTRNMINRLNNLPIFFAWKKQVVVVVVAAVAEICSALTPFSPKFNQSNQSIVITILKIKHKLAQIEVIST